MPRPSVLSPAAIYAQTVAAVEAEPVVTDADGSKCQEVERSDDKSSEAVSIRTLPELYRALSELLLQQEARLTQRIDECTRKDGRRSRKKVSHVERKASHTELKERSVPRKNSALEHIEEQQEMPRGLKSHWEEMLQQVANRGGNARIVKIDERKRGVDDDSGWMDTLKSRYDIAVFVLILANMLFLGLQSQHESTHEHTTTGYRVASTVFAVIFFIDIVIRICIGPRDFFRGTDRVLNRLDIIVVSGMVVDEVMSYSGEQAALSQISILRAIRLLRVVRMVRMLRAARHFIEFQVFCAVLHSPALWRSLCVVMIFGAVMIYAMSLSLTQGAQGLCEGSTYSETDHDVCYWFGTFARSLRTLLEVMLNGTNWGSILRSSEQMEPIYTGCLFIFVAFCNIMYTNMIIGLMVKVVQDARSRLQEVSTQDNLAEQEFYIQSLMEIFNTIDVNSSGSITADELEFAMSDKYTAMLLSSLHLDVHDVSAIFSVMDNDKSHEMDLTEFVTGCMRLRGNSSASATAIMHFDLEKLAKNSCAMEARLKEIERYLKDEDDDVDDEPSLQAPGEDSEDFATYHKEAFKKKGSSTTKAQTKAPMDFFAPMDHEDYALVRDRFHTGKQIDLVEMRAMSLVELQNVRKLIHDHCTRDGWLDLFTGDVLAPQNVNLYQLNYYIICFLTAPETITLKGLTFDADRAQSGDQVGQTSGTCRVATGQVVRVTDAGDLEIKVFRGRFEGACHGRAFDVDLNGEHVGACSEVVAPGSISYKEYVSSKETKPDWYVSHWWGESAFDFIQGCALHARHRGLSNEAAYWVCAYANRQYHLEEDIVADLDQCSFVKAMKASSGVLLLLDVNGSAFSRIWCGFELIRTCTDSTKLLDIAAVREQNGTHVQAFLADGVLDGESLSQKQRRERQFPLSTLVIGLHSKLEEGKATMESDRLSILDYVERAAALDGHSREEALENANSVLHYLLARIAWPQALKRGLVYDLDAENPGTLCLPRIMSACSATRLELNFGNIEEVHDEDMIAIGEGLPITLEEVYLNFYMCKHITNNGVESLARRLPQDIRALRLDFLGCKHVTDLGLTHLGRNLPASLQELRLDFATCSRITNAGLIALHSSLPKSITKFGATFVGTEVDRNFRNKVEFDQFCMRATRETTGSNQLNRYAAVLTVH